MTIAMVERRGATTSAGVGAGAAILTSVLGIASVVGCSGSAEGMNVQLPVRSFRYVAGTVTEHTEWAVGDIGHVLSFGQDAARNLYITSSNGNVYKVVARSEE